MMENKWNEFEKIYKNKLLTFNLFFIFFYLLFSSIFFFYFLFSCIFLQIFWELDIT